jgi:hypothetical protein
MPDSPLRPLRPHNEDEGPHSPEALMISALLETGMFDPESYRLTDEMPACYKKLWRFGSSYHRQTSMAPSLELVKTKFPDFPFTANVDPVWAAKQLVEAHANRELRRKIHKALTALDQDELNEAYDELSTLNRPKTYRPDPVGAFDHSLLEEQDDELAIEVPWRTLGMLTGGMKSGETWVLAARQYIGKSMLLNPFCKAASNAGFRVRWISLEMPKRQVASRLWKCMAGRDHELRRQLDHPDVLERKAALDILQSRYPVIP